MAKAIEHFTQNYLCPKCRGHKPDVREIALSKSGLLDLLPTKDTRYIEVTCILCGYTEFYNRAIYVKSLALETDRQEIPLPEEAKGP